MEGRGSILLKCLCHEELFSLNLTIILLFCFCSASMTSLLRRQWPIFLGSAWTTSLDPMRA